MAVTKVFRSGNSQAVRIPKDLQFDAKTKEVEIFRRGGEVVLRERRGRADLIEILDSFSDDFMKDGRQQPPPQERESLD